MTTPATLPELGDDRVAAMERELFARIADEPSPAPVVPRARRGRVWAGALAGAAAVVVALVVLPAIGTAVVGGSDESGSGSAVALPGTVSGDAPLVQSAPADGAESFASTDVATDATARAVIASGSATVRVADVAAAIAAIGADATARGGYVESTSTDAGYDPVPIDGSGAALPSSSGYGSITVRVPADELADATAALSAVGEVTASAVSQQDVTDQTIDLSARVESLQATVDRLTALIAQAQNVQDVIAVESELSARQADLESYRQQLEYLQGQVALSSLSVTVVPDTTPVAADPAGFGDGLAAGWNGLVATVNALVIAVGFLLPWLGVAAVAAAIVWLVIRLVRRRRAPAGPPSEPVEETTRAG